MRLLGCRDLLPVAFTIATLPPYAIISHTHYGDHDEVTLKDLVNGSAKRRRGFNKLLFCARKALDEGLEYLWMDTCCIDVTSDVERTEAVLSSFRWYQNAKFCYVCLSDINTPLEKTPVQDEGAYTLRTLPESRWFTRGWTLMELLAPPVVKFFSSEEQFLGTKKSLKAMIARITNIPEAALEPDGFQDESFTPEQKLSWLGFRKTARAEDRAYCMLGLLNVSMSLEYGEGESRAMERLRSQLDREGLYRTRSHGMGLIVYPPIDHTSFRILQVQAGPETQSIKAQFVVHKLNDPVSYYALSYTWGSEPPGHEIIIGGKSCLVRPNLFHALRRIRSPTENIYLWVDSLCIQQIDAAERATQVRQMFRIFTQAKDVWIWLGEEQHGSTQAMKVVERIIEDKYVWDQNWWQDNEMIAFEKLLHRPWFRRAWVVQEAAVAKTSTIHCGESKVSGKDFIKAVRCVQQRMDEKRDNANGSLAGRPSRDYLSGFRESAAVRLLDIIEQVFKESPGTGERDRQMSLEQLINLCTASEMTDQRDVIYSVLSLTKENDPSSEFIVSDYKKPLLSVYADYIRYCAKGLKSLDVLTRPWAPDSEGHADVNGVIPLRTSSDERQLPSWICGRNSLPFGNPSAEMPFRMNGTSLVGRYGERRYNAHNGIEPVISIGRKGGNKQDRDYCDGRLKVVGIILGEIISRSPRMPNAVISRTSLELSALSTAPAAKDTCHELCRLLCADRDAQGKPAPHEPFCKAFAQAWELSLQEQGEIKTDFGEYGPTPNCMDLEDLLTQNISPDLKAYLEVVRDMVWNRRTFQGVEGELRAGSSLVGLIPQHAKAGDKICIIYGLSVPVILREVEGEEDCWTLIGEAYVHGYMDGEAFSQDKDVLAELEHEFILN